MSSLLLLIGDLGLSEECAWGLSYNVIKQFNYNPILINKIEHLQITDSGSVRFDGSNTSVSVSAALAAYGVTLFHALDYGCGTCEERLLSQQLEAFISALTDSTETLESALDTCTRRITHDAEQHYRHVLQQFLCEANQLKTLKRLTTLDDDCHETTEARAKQWMTVMHEMRAEPKPLRHVTPQLKEPPIELTPFECAMKDVRMKRFRLKKIPVKERQNDSHADLLEWIRKRPLLVPCESRHVRQLQRSDSLPLFERLMNDIRNDDRHRLKHVTESVVVTSQPATPRKRQDTPQQRRRLIKADVRLDDSLDDSAARDSELTLEEVTAIRKALTSAEFETLAVTDSIRDDIQNQRICFACLKTRFSLLWSRPHTCNVCARAVCDKCVIRDAHHNWFRRACVCVDCESLVRHLSVY